MRLSFFKFSSGGRAGFWAFLLMELVLAIQYFGGWSAVWLARFSKETELENHLTDLGRLASTAQHGPR